ncbi:hypothetical protein VA7868_03385 [Vibrio aerogenes CECT 7868]|uniref:Lipoprotein n=1 Tax=Vibrio aerogenes CECT 7868 TaxID=1216006 RepID=A0A1M5ZXE3_9VIBR|nr:hypothetical protein [Vibrio aerogenes]SHI28947.1 hypothetical protein VA7868_03385 [Vibrio aerogenes CECT 7868]
MFRSLLIGMVLLLGGCSTSQVSDTVYLQPGAKVALLPVVNRSQTPLAGASAANMLASLWYQKGLPALLMYPDQAQGDLSFSGDDKSMAAAQAWADEQTADYTLQGSISEWRYKSGLDGDPVVSVTLTLYQTGNQAPVWSGTVSKTGWGRDNLSGTGLDVLDDLLDNIEVEE